MGKAKATDQAHVWTLCSVALLCGSLLVWTLCSAALLCGSLLVRALCCVARCLCGSLLVQTLCSAALLCGSLLVLTLLYWPPLPRQEEMKKMQATTLNPSAATGISWSALPVLDMTKVVQLFGGTAPDITSVQDKKALLAESITESLLSLADD